jgi:hypothetical protein
MLRSCTSRRILECIGYVEVDAVVATAVVRNEVAVNEECTLPVDSAKVENGTTPAGGIGHTVEGEGEAVPHGLWLKTAVGFRHHSTEAALPGERHEDGTVEGPAKGRVRHQAICVIGGTLPLPQAIEVLPVARVSSIPQRLIRGCCHPC